MKELKTCRCGTEVRLDFDGTFYRIECQFCGNKFLGCTNRQHVVDGWNKVIAGFGSDLFHQTLLKLTYSIEQQVKEVSLWMPFPIRPRSGEAKALNDNNRI
jgi:hypothetical protein